MKMVLFIFQHRQKNKYIIYASLRNYFSLDLRKGDCLMIDTNETIRLLAKLILRQDEKINELRDQIDRMSKHIEVYEEYIKGGEQ